MTQHPLPPCVGAAARAELCARSARSAHARLYVTLNHLSAETPKETTPVAPKYTPVALGAKYTQLYANYVAISDAGGTRVGSYFHDVPLALDMEKRTATMVAEVPRWSNGKFEISTTLPGNPIVQDVKKGRVRFVGNLFPYHGYIHNYGAFPQTWEDPTVASDIDGLYGDGDPLDVCEIGADVMPTGTVKTVRILGSLALVDDGELDWKIIAVNTADALAADLFDIADVFVHCPGLLEATRQWFRDYKMPDGKPPNKFALSGAYRSLEETMAVVAECHAAWRRLVAGETKTDKFAVGNVTVEGSPGFSPKFDFNDAVLGGVAEPDAPVPDEVHKSHYLSQ